MLVDVSFRYQAAIGRTSETVSPYAYLRKIVRALQLQQLGRPKPSLGASLSRVTIAVLFLPVKSCSIITIALSHISKDAPGHVGFPSCADRCPCSLCRR